MDTTDKYIKMCKNAEEIQSAWVYKSGDYGHFYKHVVLLHTVGIEKYKYVWIPRQDQLQDILSDTATVGYLINGLDAFYDPESQCGYSDPPCRSCRNLGERRRATYDTMEEFWIGFVMYERFGKEWDAEKSEWVKEEQVE